MLKKVSEEMNKAKSEFESKKNRAPKSKKERLEKLYDWMEKGKKAADDELIERQRENLARCHCDGSHCEC